jgi:hypothetical protein
MSCEAKPGNVLQMVRADCVITEGEALLNLYRSGGRGDHLEAYRAWVWEHADALLSIARAGHRYATALHRHDPAKDSCTAPLCAALHALAGQ